MSPRGGTRSRQHCFLKLSIDEYVSDDNPVRFIDAFGDSLDIIKLGFKHAEPDNGPGRAPDPSS